MNRTDLTARQFDQIQNGPIIETDADALDPVVEAAAAMMCLDDMRARNGGRDTEASRTLAIRLDRLARQHPGILADATAYIMDRQRAARAV